MTNKDNEISKKYQKKTDREHILDNPDTYIGSIEINTTKTYIYDENINKIIEKQINYIPGLYKLFDEGIVNCRDHFIRMLEKTKKDPDNNYNVSNINISIENDIITLYNDGNGIDITEHPEYKIWIPELIFGHLRTSTNYNKDEKKIVGGKNGFGFKLVLIWSTWGKIETVDHIRGLKYTQEFTDNLQIINKPKITKCKTKPYTSVSFKPDFQRLKINGFDNEFISLMLKRIYDIAAVTDKTVKVKYNSKQLQIKSFQDYIDLYIGNKNDTQRIYENINDRWEYAICISPNEEFTQISFVNGIFTAKGGKHVEYIINQIIKKLINYIKLKKHIDVKPASIKEQLMIFINCTIENPSFDSQTKEFLTTSISNFGSSCEVSDKFIEKVAKLGVMTMACSLTELKDNKAAKKTDGSKIKTIRNIPKLVDANFAGTSKSKDCVLILCEGDSAKSGIISGLSREDRNIIGVYPMRGKLLNIRGETISKISDNKEITEIKQIIGLQNNVIYTENDISKKLRYGQIIFMTDQDLDGSHIKGLVINMFDSAWNSLLKIPNFIGYMNTPILKARKGNEIIQFYNNGEYDKWKENNDVNKWNIKYYKGLGTSTSKEFKEYFEKRKFVTFVLDNNSNDAIDMVFNKNRTNDRKEWLSTYDRKIYLDTNNSSVSYKDFIDKEFKHFSKYDNDRSIPNICDGLKVSLRKILYSAFKKNLNSEIKVAQFSGYVSEHSGYHHGEESLNKAIIGLAQNYVGSNNINLFKPIGQLGTRMNNGADAASPRYIFTQLSKITRYIFPEIDDKILTYLDDDGLLVEPIYYVPIIPMILVNGTKGIGTGFSTDIMCYNPIDIINYLKNKLLNNNDNIIIEPYYKGFTGKIIKKDDKKYLIKGIYNVFDENTINVIELPIGLSTQNFKEYLEKLLNDKDKSYIKSYIDYSTDIKVEFNITFIDKMLDHLISENIDGIDGIEKYLKLTNTHSINNMHLFDDKENLKKYENVYQIINHYYDIRLHYYQLRKNYLIQKIQQELIILDNKVRYIQGTLDDKIDLRKKTRDTIYNMLEKMKFDKDIDKNNFDYLIKMPMDSVTTENIEKLLKDFNFKKNELDKIIKTTIENLWYNELDNLLNIYNEFILEDINENTDTKKKYIKKFKK